MSSPRRLRLGTSPDPEEFPCWSYLHEHGIFVLILCVLALGSAFWHCEGAHVLGPHESVPQGVHYARLPHGF